jgi:ADP-heptose:LPS heptosyltransferase
MRFALSESDLRSREFQRILLIKPSSLGDVVHALPVLRGLRRRYPQARIDWLISSSLSPLLEGHPDLNELVLFDRHRFGLMAYSPKAALDFVRFIGRLRASRYDLVIDLQGLFRSGFLARASGASVRIGFARAREGASLFYNHRLSSGILDAHAVDRLFGRPAAGLAKPHRVPHPLNEVDRSAEQLLRQAEGRTNSAGGRRTRQPWETGLAANVCGHDR